MDTILYLSTSFLSIVIGQLLINKYYQGLNNIPGPWLASTTNLWRVLLTLGRRPEVVHKKLHKKYGDVVRMGPSFVSITDLETVKRIFSPNSGYIKSDMYPVQQTVSHGKILSNLFSSTDEVYHARLRRAVASSYSMSTIVKFEPLVTSTVTAFIEALEKRFADRSDDLGVCDFGTWLHFFAFDVIGEITWSKRLGFVEQGVDIEGIIHKVDKAFAYFAVVGQMPWLDLLWMKNPVLLWLSSHGLLSNTISPVALFARKRMMERENQERREAPLNETQPLDLLSRFQQAAKKDPTFLNDRQILALTLSSIFAGADTTAITLRAIFYFLLKDPTMMAKLMHELNGIPVSEYQIVSWTTARSLPYLTAVIHEALRIFPAVGLPLERVVPPAGLEVKGHFIPGGTIIGASAWTIHAKEEIFGERTEEFRPERWLEFDEGEQKRMENSLFTFGYGSRVCIGKNVSLLEIYKVVPTILLKFELELVDPKKEWKLFTGFLATQSDFEVLLRRRK
ncbi:pisatin demethylase [Stipitochalara longipes BDJ]|nr:pisatin demethylase [Stipitochalara longipes BDJ]